MNQHPGSKKWLRGLDSPWWATDLSLFPRVPKIPQAACGLWQTWHPNLLASEANPFKASSWRPQSTNLELKNGGNWWIRDWNPYNPWILQWFMSLIYVIDSLKKIMKISGGIDFWLTCQKKSAADKGSKNPRWEICPVWIRSQRLNIERLVHSGFVTVKLAAPLTMSRCHDAAVSWKPLEALGIWQDPKSENVNPRILLNHGLLIRGYSSNSHVIQYFFMVPSQLNSRLGFINPGLTLIRFRMNQSFLCWNSSCLGAESCWNTCQNNIRFYPCWVHRKVFLSTEMPS